MLLQQTCMFDLPRQAIRSLPSYRVLLGVTEHKHCSSMNINSTPLSAVELMFIEEQCLTVLSLQTVLTHSGVHSPGPDGYRFLEKHKSCGGSCIWRLAKVHAWLKWTGQAHLSLPPCLLALTRTLLARAHMHARTHARIMHLIQSKWVASSWECRAPHIANFQTQHWLIGVFDKAERLMKRQSDYWCML